MYAPRVFVSMTGAILAFGIASYFINGSLVTTLIQTVICAVLLQVGYFVGVLYLVRREKMQRDESPLNSSIKRHSESGAVDASAKLKISDR